MYLRRFIYDKMLEWKNNKSHSTLEICGARQVGKTFIINKFADENYNKKIYINLFESSGQRFLKCYNHVMNWTPGMDRSEQPLHDILRLYEPDFVDSDRTVIIIDEIQESAEIYNRVREFTRQFKSNFIITGSYLGRIYDKEFNYSCGDTTKLIIYTLSFEEFLLAYDKDLFARYKSLENFIVDKCLHDSLKYAYDIYCQIGGYPKVVHVYLESKDMSRAQIELTKIVNTFTNESIRYFNDILDTRVFTHIFYSICRMLVREKKGLVEGSISEELQKIAVKDYSSNVSKASCNRAISWLYFSGIIGFCAKIIEMDVMDFKPASRCYFMDLGMANYYLMRIGADTSTRMGILNENYVYINLKQRQDMTAEVAFETPAFATYRGGEIDFVVQSMPSAIRYLLEVKTGRGVAGTAKTALEHGKADKLLYLKGNTLGGIDGKIETVPIYLLERYKFDPVNRTLLTNADYFM